LLAIKEQSGMAGWMDHPWRRRRRSPRSWRSRSWLVSGLLAGLPKTGQIKQTKKRPEK